MIDLKRLVVELTPDEVYGLILPGTYEVNVSDRVVMLNQNEIILNIISLMPFKYVIDRIPNDDRCLITTYYKNGYYNIASSRNMMGVITDYIVETYVKLLPYEEHEEILYGDEGLYTRMLGTNNDIFSLSNKHFREYALTIDLDELMLIPNDEELKVLIGVMKKSPTEKNINNVYGKVMELLSSDKYSDSLLVLGMNAGMYNIGQILQLLGLRGFIDALDRSIYADPITTSFMEGMYNNFALGQLSVPAAQSMLLSTIAIRNTEKLGRVWRLSSMVLKNMVRTDCGQTDYFSTIISKESFNGYVGNHYYNEASGEEEIIGKDDKHLIDKVTPIRHLSRCKLGKEGKICSACLGDLAYRITSNGNLGYIANSTLAASNASMLLGAKHLTASVKKHKIQLTPTQMKTFKMFNNGIRATKLVKSIIINGDDGFGISFLSKIPDLSRYDVEKLTRINKVYIKGSSEGKYINMKNGTKTAFCTEHLLQWIKDNGYSLDEYNNYVIDMTGYDNKKPMFNYVVQQFSVIDWLEEQRIMTAPAVSNRGLIKMDPDELSVKLHNVVSSKMEIPFPLISLLIFSITGNDPLNNDFSLGGDLDTRRTMKLSYANANRGLGAGYDADAVIKRIFDPTQYIKEGKLDHAFDPLLEIILESKG